MKKLTTLVLAAGLVVSSFAGSASAAEFKPFAQFAEELTFVDGPRALQKDGTYAEAENFNAATRIRFGFDYVASEDLSATMLFQYRKGSWGHNGDDFTADPEAAMTGAGDHFRMRLAYIDWTIPTTEVKVRMGRQAVVTPSYAFGSPILDGRADAISVNGAVNDNITLGAAWMRLDSEYNGFAKADYQLPDGTWTTGAHEHEMDDADALMLQAQFAYDGWKVAPWAMYIVKQGNAGANFEMDTPMPNHMNAYVLGLSAELSMFDPFVFAVDALYNNIDFSHKMDENGEHYKNGEDNFDGFYVGAKASYKFSNGTAALGGWYATGDDLDDRANNKFNDNMFVVLDGGFGAGTILFGDNIIGCDAYNTLTGDTPFGTWGLVAEYANFSFLDKLTHTARVVYVQGTNEGKKEATGARDFLAWTEDDKAVEFDFNSTYEIYKNFSATLELGYVLVDQSNLQAGVEEQDDIFRSALTFVYNF